MSAPVYDLAVQGYRGFSRFGTVLSKREISRDPLLGVIDGANLVFQTNYFPILTTGSLAVFVGGVSVAGSANYNNGEVVLNDQPAQQPRASYTFTPYSPNQILQFLITGFEEMEGRWNRDWKLVDSLGAAANEDSATVLVADSDGADPNCNGTLFSNSISQIAFFLACAEYRYQLSQMGDSADKAYMWRETVRGMTVDKSRVPQNQDLLLARLEKRLAVIMLEAQEQFAGGANYGGFYAPAATAEYMGNFEWQTSAILNDYRSNLGYQFGFRQFGG